MVRAVVRRLNGLVLSAALAGCSTAHSTDAPKGSPPIVLVSMDTLRADRLGVYGNPGGLTPNLDKFAKEAVVFDGAYSQAIQTAPSHASVFTSRYPSEQTDAGHQPSLPPDATTLARLLALYGYDTAAFVGGADLSPFRKLNVGFNTYLASVDFGSLYHTTPLALDWLDKADRTKPYFLMVHGYDTHSLYLKPTPYGYLYADAAYGGEAQTLVRTATERLIDGLIYPNFSGLLRVQTALLRPRAPENRQRVADLMKEDSTPKVVTPQDIEHIGHVYDGAVSYADAMFGTLMAGFKSRGVLDNAYVIVMSDHGEQLGEHGLFGHCCAVGEEETHVVLMIRAPRGANGGRHIPPYSELVDILPTVAEIAGATPPAGVVGRSLLPAVLGQSFTPRPFAHSQGTAIARSVSVRGPGGRLTYSGLDPTSPELADLVATARLDGPGFLGSDADSAARPALRSELERWIRGLQPSPGSVPATRLPDALRQSLRDHGYFEVDP